LSGIAVNLRPGESQEKLLKRFVKRCKKEDIIKEYLEKTAFYKSKKQRRREKRRKNFWISQKSWLKV